MDSNSKCPLLTGVLLDSLGNRPAPHSEGRAGSATSVRRNPFADFEGGGRPNHDRALNFDGIGLLPRGKGGRDSNPVIPRAPKGSRRMAAARHRDSCGPAKEQHVALGQAKPRGKFSLPNLRR